MRRGDARDAGLSTVVRGRVGEAFAAAPAFLRAHLVVVAAVLGLGVVVTGFVVSQTRTSSVAVGVTPAAVSSAGGIASTPGATPIASGSPSGATAAAQIRVHVLGAVAKPGIVQLPAGSRVADAITAAGGLTANAGPGELNLAAVVPDGSQIVIGTKREPRGDLNTGSGGSGAGGGSAATGTGTRLVVDLNSATQEQLEALPGIGEVTAARILEWRQSHGRFNRIDELQEVSGIGEKTLQQLTPYVRV